VEDLHLLGCALPKGHQPPDSEATKRWKDFFENLSKAEYLQVGGNETVGHGWVRLAVLGATDLGA